MLNLCQVCWREKPKRYMATVCEKCFYAYNAKRNEAQISVRYATLDGTLTRPLSCEICNSKPNLMLDNRPNIVAHHFNGYANPIDVWWICTSCNMKLRGPFFHSGLVTKEQAKIAIKDLVYKRSLIEDYYEKMVKTSSL